jgi:hypothetical protein
MTTNHTPGPWRVVSGTEGSEQMGEDNEIVAKDGTHVVCFGHDYDDYGGTGARWVRLPNNQDATQEQYDQREREVKANAVLIAAAPKTATDRDALLAAAQELTEHYMPLPGSSWLGDGEREAWDALHAAITQAEKGN